MQRLVASALLCVALFSLFSCDAVNEIKSNDNPSEKMGVVLGKVILLDSTPVVGAIVNIPNQGRDTTDAQGAFMLRIPDGYYTMSVTADGVTEKQVQVQSIAKDTTTIIIPVVRRQVPAAGLVAYLPFDGSLTDVTGNGNNATSQGGSSYSVDRFDVENSALDLGSFTRAEIDHGGRLDFMNSDFTIAFWFRMEGTDAFNGVMNAGSEIGGSYFRIMTYKQFLFAEFASHQSGGSTLAQLSAEGKLDNKWHLMTLVGNRSEQMVHMYIDGVEEDRGSLKVSDIANGPIQLGFFGGPSSNAAHGPIDDLRFYDRALSTADIAKLYTEGGWKP